MDCLTNLIREHGKLGSAWFNADRTHRYLLLRGGELDVDDPAPLVVFLMLNPSTADADQNDPTIAKCIKFAAKYTGGSPHRVAIVNLYAIRATDPDVAFAHPAPVGEVNDDVILGLAARSDVMLIAAWGADKRSTARAREVYKLLRDKATLYRIGPASKDGHPKHPLYLRDATELQVHSW